MGKPQSHACPAEATLAVGDLTAAVEDTYSQIAAFAVAAKPDCLACLKAPVPARGSVAAAVVAVVVGGGHSVELILSLTKTWWV